MKMLDKIFGRAGNRMFQMAFCYAYAKDNGTDFYFQDPKFFEKYEKEIKEMYSQNIIPSDYVGIHVRRAGNPTNPAEPNYSDNPFYVDLSKTDYYERAMNMFPLHDFMVFSDDIEWCKKQPLFKNCIFSDKNEEEDFNRMAGCRALIIANSSFSWWAGYLCQGMVVAPKVWYTDGVERTKTPKSWLRI